MAAQGRADGECVCVTVKRLNESQPLQVQKE